MTAEVHPDEGLRHSASHAVARQNGVDEGRGQAGRESANPDSIHGLIELQVARWPDVAAARCGHESLTYSELDRRANQLADVLLNYGIGGGARVGILLAHSIETVVALVGVLKSGAAYVPLDVDSPPARIRAILDDADVSAVVTTSRYAPLSASERRTLLLDHNILADASEDCAGVHVSPEDPAYVIYSSGSTGAPKAIVIPHRALVRYVLWANSVYVDGGNDGALHSSLAFDLTVTSIFVPLTSGGAVVAYASHAGQPSLLDVLREDRVDFIKLTPSHLRLIVERPVQPSRLRTLIVGGENLDTALARRAHDRFDGRVTIFNEYGPTETTVGCMLHRFDPQKDRRHSVPLGQASAGTTLYLIDETGRPVGAAGIGEIHIGGPGLALEYLNAPALTAERFIADPFDPGRRIYRTGDLAERLPDGALEFVGRKDDQIKVRGHRIHLNEIQHVLLQYPQVNDCVVRLLADVDGTQVLVAYYTSASPIDPKALRVFARGQLPAGTVPNRFVFLERLPLTVNGKIDMQALPGWEWVDQRSSSSDERPRTDTERQMADMWCRLLRSKEVGIRENFFDLGGDSLAAVRLVLEIEATFGIRLPTDALFTDSTIEGLARRVDDRQSSARSSPLIPMRPTGKRPPLFVLHGIGGEIMFGEPLVRHLPSDQPVYGLKGDGINFASGTVLEIEAMATKYLDAIREVQPEGPYYLAGYSAGAITAYEIARQIRDGGDQVGLLAVIDGDAPPAVRMPGRWTPRVLGRFLANLVFLAVDDVMVSTWADLRRRLFSKVRLLGASTPKNGNSRDIRDVVGVPELLDEYVPWLEAFVDAIAKYRPGRYSGRLTLLRARTFGLFQPVTYDRGWSALVDNLDIRVLKGNHASILREPLVRQLANELARLLDARIS